MIKIPVYLYSNRITILINLDNNLTNTEWRIVYQRNIKIYKGINNVIELELKNLDQKRIEIGSAELKLVLMDQSRNQIATYTALSLEDSTIKGLARITIPSTDLEDFSPQYLRFLVFRQSVEDTLTYTDSQFGAIGTIELLNGMNTDVITPIRYDRFTQETNYTAARYEERKIKYHSEAIHIQTYQAMPVTLMSLSLYLNEFKGKIEILGTKNEIIGNEAFLNAKILYSSNFTLLQNGPLLVPNLDVEELTYLRVSYEKTAGKIDYIKIHN